MGLNVTKEDLLKEFPDHKLIVHHVDMDNNITDVFTYYDRVELECRLLGIDPEDRILDIKNKNRLQGELFL